MKAKTTGTLTIVALAAVLAAVFFLSRPAAVEAVYPVERAKNVWVRRVWARCRGIFRGAEAAAENVRLKRAVAALSLVRDDLDRLEAENARLRKVLGYAARSPGEWVAASVLSEGGGAIARYRVRVDKGSLAGVRPGAIATVPDGVVGVVASVTPHTAEVALLCDRAVRVACEIEQPGGVRTRGILCGGTEDLLSLRHLTNAQTVAPRSRVVTSGLGGVFPKGLAVGTLHDIHNGDDGLPYRGDVLPSVDFSTLEDVFIRREK